MQFVLSKRSNWISPGMLLQKHFDTVLSTFGFLLLSGLIIDGYAHAHGMVGDTFFTPWHGIMYGMYLANAVLLCGRTISTRIVPAGYEYALIGVILFPVGGLFDLWWHTMFGFETGTEPLISPSHLLLAISGTMIIAGSLCSTLRKLKKHITVSVYSLLLPVISILGMISFFTGYTNTLLQPALLVGIGGVNMAISGIMLQSIFVMGMVLFLLKYAILMPRCLMTILLTCSVLGGIIIAHAPLLLIPVVLSGVLADIVRYILNPSYARVIQLRIFMFLVPFMLYLSFFIEMIILRQTTWLPTLWMGGAMLAGVASLLLTFLVIHPSE